MLSHTKALEHADCQIAPCRVVRKLAKAGIQLTHKSLLQQLV
jgi:hypothetical protein